MRYVLIEASPTIDNLDNNPICVHAILDDNDRIAGQHAIFGVYGNWQRMEEDFAPFVLGPKGKVDFGSGYDRTGERHPGRTSLRDVYIRLGTLFSWDEENKTYRISGITPLPKKA